MIRLGLLGATGRMGRSVAQVVASHYKDQATVVFAPTRSESLQPLLSCQAVIDFSSPQAVENFVDLALQHRESLPALVVGSTGWTPEQRKCLNRYAQVGAVLQSSNFSLGVQALLLTLRQVSPLLRRLGYQPALTETHHVHKKDAPSGTALAIEAAVRADGSAPFPIQSVREGEVIGLHSLEFQGPADRLTFCHEALDRSLFARGAVEIALWLASQPSVIGWRESVDFLTQAHLTGERP